MIASKIAPIYEVDLPADVKALLDFFDSIVSVGVPFLATPLQCFGTNDFTSRLLFFFLFPFVILALLFGVHFAKIFYLDEKDHVATKSGGDHSAADRRKLSQAQGAKAVHAPLGVLLERAAISATPAATQFLFVVYPILTTVAFEAFPCHGRAQDDNPRSKLRTILAKVRTCLLAGLPTPDPLSRFLRGRPVAHRRCGHGVQH